MARFKSPKQALTPRAPQSALCSALKPVPQSALRLPPRVALR
jgi:hypothetical protein